MCLKLNEISLSFNFPMVYISSGGIMYTIMYNIMYATGKLNDEISLNF